MNDTSRATSIRLPKGMADEFAAIARACGKPIAEVMREALEQYIVSRRSDQEFKARIRKRLEEDREYLDRIGGVAGVELPAVSRHREPRSG